MLCQTLSKEKNRTKQNQANKQKHQNQTPEPLLFYSQKVI